MSGEATGSYLKSNFVDGLGIEAGGISIATFASRLGSSPFVSVDEPEIEERRESTSKL